MNMIRSAKNQIAELTAAAYRAAVQEGLLPEGCLLYTSIADQIKSQIISGALPRGSALPSERALGLIFSLPNPFGAMVIFT